MSPLAAFALAALPQVAERALDRESGRLYLRSSETLTVLDAEALARELGGALVSIGSAAEETFLLDNFGAEESYWIGLEFPRERWASGEPVEFTHWAAGEPGGGAREPFTLMNWTEPGAWVDASGDADTQRFRALIELPSGAAPEPAPATPAPRGAGRCVLVCAIQDLTAKDLESARLPALNALWKGAAWTADAAADPSGDPLAGLGALLWGVGSARSRLAAADPSRAARDAHENVLARIERLSPDVSTAALLDDLVLGGILLDGRVDVRVTDASPRKGGSQAPLADALARAAPLFVVATWTDLAAAGADARESERARALAAIDAELGALLAAVRARPSYASESWWIAVAGLAPRPAKRGKPDEDPRARTAVPVCVVAPGATPGPILSEVALVDLGPSALLHLGLAPRASWQLDGRALTLDPAPLFGAELLENGGAEDQPGWFPGEAQAIRGWRQLAPFRVAKHGAEAGGPSSRGLSFFEGGGGALARMEQTLDLRALAADVDRGAVRFRLGGWLGTRGRSQATIECALELLDEKQKTLERVALGPVGQGERREKLGAEKGVPREGLIELSAEGRVPRRARAARVVLLASGPGVALAMADELSLVLEKD